MSRDGTTTILLACDATAGRCRGTLALAVSYRDAKHCLRTVTVAHRNVNVRAGAHARIPLTLGHTGLRLLMHARHKRLHVRATVSLTLYAAWLTASGT